MIITIATIEDAEEILLLQKIAYRSEATLYDDFTIPPMTQTLEEIQSDFQIQVYLKIEINSKIIGSVRGYIQGVTCFIGRLIVHPDYQNQGVGTRLIKAIEAHFSEAQRFESFTGEKSERTIHIYKKQGYQIFKTEQLTDRVRLVYLEKEKTA
jgi:N-acetylglutamate synthase-like GNAT family acetyltransferase